MSEVIKVTVGNLVNIIQPIFRSLSSDNVIVKIKSLANGQYWNFASLTFEDANNTGIMSWDGDYGWKCSFTPFIAGQYRVIINDITQDAPFEQIFIAESTTTSTPSTSTAPTNAEILVNIRTAINTKMTGGAVQSYKIGERNIAYYSLDELMRLETFYSNKVAAETAYSNTTYIEFEEPI